MLLCSMQKLQYKGCAVNAKKTYFLTLLCKSFHIKQNSLSYNGLTSEKRSPNTHLVEKKHCLAKFFYVCIQHVIICTCSVHCERASWNIRDSSLVNHHISMFDSTILSAIIWYSLP